MDETRIEGHGNDVVASKPRPRAAICDGDVVRHIFAGKVRERVRGGDLHLHVDRLCAHIEGAPENIGKTEHVVDLIWIVRTPGGDDHVRARLLRVLRRDLRIGIRHRENDRVGSHRLDHLGRQRALGRQAEEDVGADHRLLEGTQRRLDRMGRLPLVHAIMATAIDDPLGVTQDDVGRFKPNRLDEVETGDAGGARAIADEAGRLDVPARQTDRVDHAGGGDDRRAMLVVVKNRNIHHLAQALFDVEALRRLDVLEIDSTEGGTKKLHRTDEFIRVFRPDLEIYGIDIGETLEQNRLSFHHRLRGQRSKIAEAEDRRPVRDDGDQVASRSVIVDRRGISRDRLDRNRDARRVGERQVPLRRHGLGRDDFEFARTTARMELQRLLVGDRGTLAMSVGIVSHWSIPGRLSGDQRLGQ